MSNLSGSTLGKYTLIERIGQGGMADVYRATSPDGREAAVKVLVLGTDSDEQRTVRQRFEREAQIIADLQHEAILPIWDYGQTQSAIYIVTRLLSGGTLSDVIRRGPVALAAACRWLNQIAAALDHAHEMQVIHRDLKPTNVLLDEQGKAYLTDFGIARFAHVIRDMTETGSVVGTPAYMAPEQWRAEALSPQTDVYGLGVMTYLMLTQHTPFEAETSAQMMYFHLHENVPPLAKFGLTVPPGVDQVLRKALAKNAADRYPTAGRFALDFQRALEGKPVDATLNEHGYSSGYSASVGVSRPYKPIPVTRLRPSTRMNWALALVLLSLLLLGLLAGGIGAYAYYNRLWKPGQDSPATPLPTEAPTEAATDASGDLPRIEINAADRERVVSVGRPVDITFTAIDPLGITRVELRRLGEVQRSLSPDNADNASRFSGTFTYMPPSIVGPYYLEIVPFRGEVAGEPVQITLQVE